jgi:hypothetical protein
LFRNNRFICLRLHRLNWWGLISRRLLLSVPSNLSSRIRGLVHFPRVIHDATFPMIRQFYPIICANAKISNNTQVGKDKINVKLKPKFNTRRKDLSR